MVTTGSIFDIKRYAIHDGPGIRTTAFLKGCSLSCPWCHNPESQNPSPEFLFWEERCVRCKACIEACQEDAISLIDDRIVTDRTGCTACGACVSVCPNRAREIVGRVVTTGEMLNEIEKDVLFYDESGGGITLSGGEPLFQPDFSQALLRECKAREIHTALDTCGDVAEADILAIAKVTDLFLYDLKLIDSEAHKRQTGISNNRILTNLRRLDERGERIWIRIPLIPGINDNPDTIDQLGAFIATLNSVEAVQLLPYHRVGMQKLKRLGRIPAPNLTPPSRETTERIAERLRTRYHLSVSIGG